MRQPAGRSGYVPRRHERQQQRVDAGLLAARRATRNYQLQCDGQLHQLHKLLGALSAVPRQSTFWPVLSGPVPKVSAMNISRLAVIGLAALAITAYAIAAPVHAQSNLPPVPSTPPDITLSCGLYGLTPGIVVSTASVQIWTSAHVLEWIGEPAGKYVPARQVLSTEIGRTQISFSGNYGWRGATAHGSIDRLSGRLFYDGAGSFTFNGMCAPAKPKF
jgi:hypothetical protein